MDLGPCPACGGTLVEDRDDEGVFHVCEDCGETFEVDDLDDEDDP